MCYSTDSISFLNHAELLAGRWLTSEKLEVKFIASILGSGNRKSGRHATESCFNDPSGVQ
jgi:hypothetical protein